MAGEGTILGIAGGDFVKFVSSVAKIKPNITERRRLWTDQAGLGQRGTRRERPEIGLVTPGAGYESRNKIYNERETISFY